jgi:hypothetical protein
MNNAFSRWPTCWQTWEREGKAECRWSETHHLNQWCHNRHYHQKSSRFKLGPSSLHRQVPNQKAGKVHGCKEVQASLSKSTDRSIPPVMQRHAVFHVVLGQSVAQRNTKQTLRYANIKKTDRFSLYPISSVMTEKSMTDTMITIHYGNTDFNRVRWEPRGSWML